MKCAVCQKREAERAQVDEGCRRRIADNLRELVDAYAVLGHHDPVSMDAGPVRGQTGSAPVSGSREAPVPVSLDEVDLTLPAREGSRAPHTRGVLGLDDCQTGYLPVATELDGWVRDWITYPWCPGDHLPVPTVVTLVDWLSKRLDVACDRHEGIDEFASDVRRLLRECQRAANDVPPRPEYLDGVPCSGCDLMALFRKPGDDYRAECGSCGKLYTDDEYERWVGMVAAQVRAA